MGGVGHQRELDFVSSVSVTSAESCSKMVLDVASLGVDGLGTLLWLNTLELGHDCLHGLAHDVGESVKTTSVRHSDHKGAGTLVDGGVDAELEAWNERFAALKTEALHGVEFAGHEGTPLMRPVQAHVHVNALGLGWVAELNGLELFTDPVALLFVLNMHELNANFVAVSFAVSGNEFAQNPLGLALQDRAATSLSIDRELTVHVSLSETIEGGVNEVDLIIVWEAVLFGETRAVFVDIFQFQRVNIRNQMAVRHEGANKHLKTDGFVSRVRSI